MRKICHGFLALFLSLILTIPLSLALPSRSFAEECGGTSSDCSFTGKTESFGSKKKKYAYSKEWRSTGAPIELEIVENTRTKDLYVPINAALEKKSGGNWKEVDSLHSLKLKKPQTFRKNIEPNVTYRVRFSLVREVHALNIIEKYRIKQKQPKESSNYKIEPSFNFTTDKIIYKFYKNGNQKSVQGNLSYLIANNSNNYRTAVDYLGWRMNFSPTINLLPQKTHYAGESNPTKKKSTVHAKFIGSMVGESTVFKALSSLDIYRYTTGNLKVDKEVKANGDIKLKISLPKHYPTPNKSAKVSGTQWKIAIKQDKKVVDHGDRIDFKDRSFNYTIKRSKIDPNKQITVDVKLNAYDLKTKSTGSSQVPTGSYKEMNIYQANGIQSFKLDPSGNDGSGGNQHGGGGKNNGGDQDDSSKDQPKDDDKKDEGKNKEAKIELDAKVLKDKKEVEITAKLKKANKPKGDWTLTFNAGEKGEKVEKFQDQGSSVTKKFSFKDIDQDEVKIVAKFKGKDKKGKIEVQKEKTVKIRDNGKKDEEPKDDHDSEDVNKEANIELNANVLANQKKVEIEATLKEVNQPEGKWKLIFNAGEQDEQVVEEDVNEETSLKKEFSIEEIEKETVKVIATFKGKDKKGKIDVTEEKEIKLKDDSQSDRSGENGDSDDDEGTTSNEDDVSDEVITQPQSPSGQVGGELPKTATDYGTNLLIGMLCIVSGGVLFYLRRRISES